MNLSGELRGITARGARLALPGWINQTTQGNGGTKTVYLEAQEAHHGASRYLADAQLGWRHRRPGADADRARLAGR